MTTFTRVIPMSVAFALVLASAASAQDPAQVQRWFEAGQFQQVAAASSPEAPPQVRFLAGQSFQKQSAPEQATAQYQMLAAEPESSPWHFIGRSAELLLQNATDEALANAQQAVAMAPTLTEAYFQLGMVHSKRNEWPQAAQAFDRAASLNMRYAYAHYYGGIAEYRAGHPDQMAIHFEQFLKTAPNAPERPEVMQLMRSVRGR